jgi:hypothetical protein
MNRAYLWRSVVGQRLAADLTPAEFQKFGKWLTLTGITDDDLTDLVRDWRSDRTAGESFLEYLDRIDPCTVRTERRDLPTGSLRADSEGANVFL